MGILICYLKEILILISCVVLNVQSIGEIVYAVNAGGEAVTGSSNIEYIADPLSIGESYTHPRFIYGIFDEDQILYRTERYNYESFGYDIPLNEPGPYVLVLKFSEVYFRAKNQKVFDVAINGEYVIENLDIFDKVGFEHGYDEFIEITAYPDFLMINEYKVPFNNQNFRLELLKGSHDNPKINAFYLMRGSINDAPKLPISERGHGSDKDSIGGTGNVDDTSSENDDEFLRAEDGTGSQFKMSEDERIAEASQKSTYFHERVHGDADDDEAAGDKNPITDDTYYFVRFSISIFCLLIIYVIYARF